MTENFRQESSVENSKVGADLFRRVYQKPIDDSTFFHKHYLNPRCMDTPCVIAKKDDKPIGMHWMMRQDFICDGKALTGIQGSDDAILSEEQGGLTFLKMRMQSVKIMKEENGDFEFGCFVKGEPLKIAEQFGEKEIVDLYLARLFLKEHKHKWKRFNIPYPRLLSNVLYYFRKKRILNLSDQTLDINVSENCPFDDNDYLVMNHGASLHSKRNEDFYSWKLGTKEPKSIEYVTARKNGELIGYLLLDSAKPVPQIIDWDILSVENGVAILAALVSPCLREYEYIDVSYLNVLRDEMKLFTQLGFTDMSKLWAAACICVKPLNTECVSKVTDPRMWKLRLIDADYYLNS